MEADVLDYNKCQIEYQENECEVVGAESGLRDESLTIPNAADQKDRVHEGEEDKRTVKRTPI